MFWLAVALLGAGAAFLMMTFARRPAGGGVDPSLAAHQRQVEEVEALAGRGVLAPDEAEGARNEASRRLLFAASRTPAAPRAETRLTRTLAFASLIAAPAIALGLYVMLGSPGANDAPYSQRVRAWRASDPTSLQPQQLAAVLRQAVAERPNDWRASYYLGQAMLASGDGYGALRAFDQARRLAPREAAPLEGAGEALVTLANGRVDADATRAFQAALRLNPRSNTARFQLGRGRLAAGDRAGALGYWRAIQAELPANDPRRAALAVQIAEVEGGPSPAAANDPMIRGMVASLAARLEQSPDDPEGWARLIRSYRVLGDTRAADAALVRARRLFASRPDALAVVEAQAR